MKTRIPWRLAAIMIIAVLLVFGSASRSRALNPESPEVKKMLEKSLKVS